MYVEKTGSERKLMLTGGRCGLSALFVHLDEGFVNDFRDS